jgi:hypothetical protein
MIDEYGIQHSFKSHEADDDALKKIERFRQPDAYRFSTTGWMDWTGVESDGKRGLTEELSGHPDWSFYGSIFGKYGLLAQRDRVFKRHSETTLVAAHF